MSTPSDYFAARFTPDPHRTAVWEEIARYVERDIPDRTALLELGCGYGDFINAVAVERKVAVDRHPGAREFLAPDVQFVRGDCVDLSFLDGASMGTVFASNLLEHIERPRLEELMTEISRVLKPRGRLIVLQPNYRLCAARYFDDYTHVTVFSDVSLCGFLAAHGFKVVKRIPGLLPFSMNSRLPKHPLLVRLYLRSPVRPLACQMYVVAEKG